MRLYGSTSSPFVRRVRVVAEEVGESVERVDTATEAGLAALRKITPIGKVPTACVDGRVLYDSHVIVDWLVTTRGWHDLAPPRDVWRTHNLVNAIDAALDGIVQLFYLRREGFAVDGTPYAQRTVKAVVHVWLRPRATLAGTRYVAPANEEGLVPKGARPFSFGAVRTSGCREARACVPRRDNGGLEGQGSGLTAGAGRRLLQHAHLVFVDARGGHVQPLLPYAKELVARGHEVSVAAPAEVGEALREARLEHAPFGHPGDEALGRSGRVFGGARSKR